MLILANMNILDIVLDLMHEYVFFLSDGSGFSKNVIITGTNISSSIGVDNRKKNTLILGKDPTQGLDNTTWTAKKEYT